ncbi:MAG: UDP-glucose 4-epimerase GalE [Thermodesulfobacteria bacterium]|nr:UDP-glucose 4-epimerase GalE [Thermodesulfobacteriota bacterium]
MTGKGQTANKVLVAGGAGYIGSHVVKALAKRGFEPLVYDDLSSGHREAVLEGTLIEGSLADRKRLRALLEAERPAAIMHFAAFIVVPESVSDPLKYYRNNLAETVTLLEEAVRAGVRAFIFSSSAAVYGIPEKVPIPEDHPVAPINPYGASKLFVEQILADCHRAYGLPYVSLRYFNAAGADPEGRIGEAHEPETHLIPLLLQTALGKRKSFYLYGTDYPTPDGTCIRDFIHVDDLAEVHLSALEHLLSGGESLVLNCGYGHGHSVREVVECARRVTGRPIPVEEKERRPGDPPVLVAACDRAREALGFSPRHDDLEFIIRTAWNWETNRRY